jgi:hypothetical protein
MYVCMHVCMYAPCIRACMRERVSGIQWKLTNNRQNINGVRFKTAYLKVIHPRRVSNTKIKNNLNTCCV